MNELQKLKYDSIFVTGTDTEIGKTFVTTGLVRELERQGLPCAVSKLVAAGAERTDDGWVNEDAVALRQACTDDATYTEVNPICLRAAIAPHIAAQEEGVELTVQRVSTLLMAQRSRAQAKQRLLIAEGAGGWLLPLQQHSLADVIAEHQVPVVLVVGMRLGCLNHALLTVASLEQRRVPLLGWVANTCQSEPMARYAENLATLKASIAAPLLGEITYQESSEASQAVFSPLATNLLKHLIRQ